MVMALFIVAAILFVIYAAKTTFKSQRFYPKFRNVMIVAMALSFIQIILGTQVRQYVDEQIKEIGYLKELWLESPRLNFYIHRTFSIAVFLVNVWLFYLNRKLKLGYTKMNLVMLCVIAEISTGIAMYYFDFPFLSQPLHIVIASIMIGIQFYIYLESRQRNLQKFEVRSQKSEVRSNSVIK